MRRVPDPGYPFNLDLRVEYRLGRDGLTVTSIATNVGDDTCPSGSASTPTSSPATEPIDTAHLRCRPTSGSVLDDRGLPTGEVRSVEGTEYDFTEARPIGPTQLDTAYTGLERGRDRLAWAELAEPAGAGGDRGCGWTRASATSCATPVTRSDPTERRRAVAIEPMTCPPDAFRSGRGLIILEPGQQWEGAWGMVPHEADVTSGRRTAGRTGSC